MAQDQELTGFADQAQQGDAEAICTLGFRYLYGEDGLKQNDTLAFQQFKESAELGDPRAMFNLGRCYEQAADARSATSKLTSGTALLHAGE